jgi:hypothetical protein
MIKFPLKKRHFPLKKDCFPLKKHGFPLKNGVFPLKNGFSRGKMKNRAFFFGQSIESDYTKLIGKNQ